MRLMENFERIDELHGDVKLACLNFYLKNCIFRHTVAFYQWRHMYHSDEDHGNGNGNNKEEKCENMGRINAYFAKNVDITKEVNEFTKTQAEIKLGHESEFGFTYKKVKIDQVKQYRIITFWSVGMSDPFPDDSTTLD